jgi:2-dehydropantoate 2-reductase
MEGEAELLVFGAGAIGLYLGGRLALAGVRVHFVARPAVAEALAEHGLGVAALDGTGRVLPPGAFGVSTTLADAPRPPLVLMTVKGAATESAAAELQAAFPAETSVLSFQNGVENAARIARGAPSLRAIPGMVPFNVVQAAPGEVRQTSSGRLAAARCATTERWAPRFADAGLPLDLHDDMLAVQWAKLLLNLNNPLNALAGIPLREELEDRAWRRILASLQDEALRAMQRAGIRPAKVTPLPSRWLPPLLRLPSPVFRLLARRLLSIDPRARSSMYDDRQRGRPTEVDDLCGAVVRLADANGLQAPRNRALQVMVERAPVATFYSAKQVEQALDTRLASRP